MSATFESELQVKQLKADSQRKKEVLCLRFFDARVVLFLDTFNNRVAVLFCAHARQHEIIDNFLLWYAENLEVHVW